MTHGCVKRCHEANYWRCSFVLTNLQLIRVLGRKCHTVLIAIVGLVFYANATSAQCNSANFSASDTNACLNQVITFTANNIPAFTKYTWQVGAKSFTGTDMDTLTTGFTSTGYFTVVLKLEYNNGDTCSIRKPQFIGVFSPPKAPVIQADKKQLCNINDTVRVFSKLPNIATWNWTIGQSLYRGAADSIEHVFINNGYFNVSLQVVDSNGCINTNRYDSFILVERPPKVQSSFSDTGLCDSFSLFVRPKYQLMGQSGFQYNWSFNGGTPSSINTRKPPKILYQGQGVYGFSLKMTSLGGCEYQYPFTDSLRIGDTKNFNVAKSTTSPCNEQRFNIRVSNPANFENNLVWSFEGDSLKASYNGPRANVTYQKTGNFPYDISHEYNGCRSIYSDTNKASLIKLLPKFEVDHTCNCAAPDDFRFTDLSSISPGVSAQYEWFIFNEANQLVGSSTSKNPSITLQQTGKFDVELVLANGQGCSDTLKSPNLLEIKPLKAVPSAVPNLVCGSQKVQFQIDSACLHSFSQARWWIYDSTGQLVDTLSGENPSYSFNTNGIYDVALTVETNNGCSDSSFATNVVQVTPLNNVRYHFSDTTVCKGSIVNATIKISPEDLSPQVNWRLQHATKGNINLRAKPVIGRKNEFVFNMDEPGAYNMILKVSGGKGCSDSIFVPKAILVSGIEANFTADHTTGCLPFNTTLRSKVLRNMHLENTQNPSVKYNWRIQPSNTSIIKSPNTANTSITINEVGKYNVLLTVENSDGCTYTHVEQDLFRFNFQAGFALPAIGCQNVPIYPINGTNGNNASYEWSTPRSNGQFQTSTSAENPVISFADTGRQQIQLISKLPNGCVDTAIKSINVTPFGFDFALLNPNPKCTPAQFNFENSSTNIDTFTWLFGDGNQVVTTQDAIAHVYDLSKVKPFRNNFDVSLIASNSLGCKDTLTKDTLVKVLGPNPTFAISNPEGCDPQRVLFIDSTKQVERFFFHYGDGSSADSIDFSSHVYRVKDTTKAKSVFYPYIIAADKNKCFVTYTPYDSVTTYTRSRPKFSANAPKGCAPHTVQFKSRSAFARKHYWDFNGDGKIDDTTANPSHTYAKGNYTVTLYTENARGCRDSITRSGYIRVTTPPKALFALSDSILCPNVNMGFQDRSSFTFPAKNWSWFIQRADGTYIDTIQNKQDPLYQFADTGMYLITLVATDNQACTDTFTKDSAIIIYDKLPITDPDIDYVTVHNNQEVEISWNRVQLSGFRWNELIKNEDFDNPLVIFQDPTKDDYFDKEPNVKNSSFSYQIKLLDRCGNPNRISRIHKTIHLEVSKGERPFAQLSWTPYIGWDSLSYYRIFRKSKGNAYSEIARVEPDDTFYIDETVCNVDYTYLISATDITHQRFSNSNEVKFNPYFDLKTEPLLLDNATVVDGAVNLHWHPAEGFEVNQYIIDKYSPFTGWTNASFDTKDTFFRDTQVMVDRTAHLYRVWYKDFCKQRNPPSNLGGNIVLSATIGPQDVVYHWTAYQLFNNGVAAYEFQTSNYLNGPYQTEKQFSNTVLEWIDENKAVRSDSAFYVRIKALSAGTNPDTSISNIVRVEPLSTWYVPNAFSPNNDGVNDYFYYDGMALNSESDSAFSIKMYNRWGELVFRSTDAREYWDGTKNGRDCPVGQYFYYIQFTGVNGQLYGKQGVVNIIR